MDKTESGIWFVMSPHELMASFFIPLPEPIGIPTGTPFVSIDGFDETAIQMLEHSRPELVLGKRLERGGYETHPFPAEFTARVGDPAKRAPLYWANKHLVSCSIIVHQTKASFLAKTSLDSAFAVADAASRDAMSIENIASLAEEIRQSALEDSLQDLQSLGATTIFECAVGLRAVNENPDEQVAFPEGLVASLEDVVHPIESHDAYPGSTARWTWYQVGSSSRQSAEFIRRRIDYALDIAINMCQQIQQAYYVATTRPVTLLTRARLPFILPAAIRRISDISLGVRVPLAIVSTNNNMHGLAEPEYVEDPTEIQKIGGQLSSNPLAAHADLEREAIAAYELQGDMRGAAIFAAIAAETFLDKLLLYLMWEEAQTPEHAAANWVEKLAARVKSQYSTRLGGSWDLTLNNAVGNWYKNVAELRNRVAHAAYTPKSDEARMSLKSLRNLTAFVADRLSNSGTLGKYPRTCVIILGNDEMQRRGIRTRRITALQSSVDEPEWNATFSRWFDCWQRIRREQNGIARTPVPARAYLLAVIKPNNAIEWCLHDRDAAKAIRVHVESGDIADIPKAQLANIMERAAVTTDEGSVSVFLHESPPWTAIPGEDWVEEYHLVPMAGVMVDRSDYAR